MKTDNSHTNPQVVKEVTDVLLKMIKAEEEGNIKIFISFIFNINWYVSFFSMLGWLSILAIVALIVVQLLILMIRITDKIQSKWRYIPYITIILSYICMRILFLFVPIIYANSFSLIGMFILTALSTWFILKRETNKFKTMGDMKILRDLDGPR